MQLIIHVTNILGIRIASMDFIGSLDEAAAAGYDWLTTGDFDQGCEYGIEVEVVPEEDYLEDIYAGEYEYLHSEWE